VTELVTAAAVEPPEQVGLAVLVEDALEDVVGTTPAIPVAALAGMAEADSRKPRHFAYFPAVSGTID
jgi:hypothetical protein